MRRALLLPLLLLYIQEPCRSQTTIAFQGFETGNSYSYTSNPGSGSISIVTSPVAGGLNALRLRGSANNSDPHIVFSNVLTAGYDSVRIKVSYAASGPDANDDLYLDISYDNGFSYATSVKLADGFSNGSLLFGSTYTGSQVGSCCIVSQGSNPYIYTVAASDTQVRVRIRFDESASTNTSDDYFIDNITVEGVPRPPDAPALPFALDITSNSFRASWNPVAGALGYQFDLSDANNFAANIYDSVVVTDTSVVLVGLAANTSYFFRARTVGTNGISGNSATLNTLTNHDPATAAYRTSMSGSYNDTLTWQVNNNGTSYVQASQAPGPWNPIAVLAGDSVIVAVADTVIVSAVSLATGATLILDTGSLFKLTGDLINNGLMTGRGRCSLNGTSGQLISGFGTLGDIEIDNSSGVTISSGQQRITRLLQLSSGTLFTNGHLVLASEGVANTASVAPVTGGISGTVTIERYLSAPSGAVSTGRAWRLMGTSLAGNSDNTIYNNWQNNGQVNGAGIEIWGPTGTGIAGGPHYSLKKFDPTTNTYVNVSNTQSELLFDTSGSYPFLAFVSGSYGSGNITAGAAPTVAKATGYLITGTRTYNFSSAASDLRLITNPYACPIDFEKVFTNAATLNISSKFWTVDPNLNEIGGYVLVARTAPNTYITVPSSGTAQNQFIQPGQGFFVELASGSGAALEIREDDKDPAAEQTAVFRTNNGTYETFALNLKAVPSNTAPVTIDGAMINCHNTYSNAIEPDEDAIKLSNPNESISVRSGTSFLALCGRPLLDFGDTVRVGFSGLRVRDYQLELVPGNMGAPALSAQLHDSYNNISYPVSLTNPTVFPFSVSSDTASASNNRFFVVFQGLTPMANPHLVLSGYGLNGHARLEWTVNNDNDFRYFEIERSTPGAEFSPVGKVSTAGSQILRFTDSAAEPCGYYRLKGYRDDEQRLYSNVVRISVPRLSPKWLACPNPLIGNALHILRETGDSGTYELFVFNMLGHVVRSIKIINGDASLDSWVDLSGLSNGVYLLKLVAPSGLMLGEQTLVRQ